MTTQNDLVLSREEIVEITHRVRPAEQLKALKQMGIPVHHRKHDNTLCVLRMHVTVPAAAAAAQAANDEPQLKSLRK
jgi:hypothetical protein